MEGMSSVMKTVKSIDEHSMKIVFKHFDLNKVNILAREMPPIIQELN